MRGKGLEGFEPLGSVGITPAWAGKSYRVYHCLASCWNHPRNAGKRWDDSAARTQCRDHPRMGGEKLFQSPLFRLPLGSPPHGRGKGGLKKPLVCGIRITPARAGKRPRRSRRAAPARDHPRVGGEKVLIGAGAVGHWGSPPRGRGKGKFNIAFIVSDGITPAWAGKRTLHRFHRLACRDHPRMGGEKGVM